MPGPELPDIALLFREAADLQRCGRLAEAEQLYLRLLAAEPGHLLSSPPGVNSQDDTS
jgi:hypothetical protein